MIKIFNKKNNEESIKIKEEVIEYAKFTYNEEKNREQTIYAHSNCLMTSISILLVSITTIIFKLMDELHKSKTLIIIFGIILIAILFTSLLLSLISHWLYKREFPRGVLEYFNYINNNSDDYLNNEGFYDQKIDTYNSMIDSLSTANDKRVKLLMSSSILMYSFMFLLFAFTIVILIVEV